MVSIPLNLTICHLLRYNIVFNKHDIYLYNYIKFLSKSWNVGMVIPSIKQDKSRSSSIKIVTITETKAYSFIDMKAILQYYS